MNFIRCEICHSFAFELPGTIYFTVKNQVPALVNLDGQEPWSGVRGVCAPCATFLGACAAQARQEDVS